MGQRTIDGVLHYGLPERQRADRARRIGLQVVACEAHSRQPVKTQLAIAQVLAALPPLAGSGAQELQQPAASAREPVASICVTSSRRACRIVQRRAVRLPVCV